MFVLSIDTATKSLAVSIVEYNTKLANNIDDLYNQYLHKKSTIHTSDKNANDNKIIKLYINLLSQVNILLDEKIKIHYINVIDLIPNRKVTDASIQEKTKALYEYLMHLDTIITSHCINPSDWIFLLENQMGPNTKSNTISAQIIYHLTKYNIPIELVGPTLKNKIIIGADDSNYSNFVEKRSTNYAANKAHTRFCFNRLLNYMNKSHIISDNKIKKANVDDIADSVLQGLAYMIKYKGF